MMNNESFRLLAISGSLREKSYNSLALRTAARLAPDNVTINIFEDVASIPLFNPDFEDQPGKVVSRLKQMLAEADGMLIATPEYAHGISGVFKNTLDWLVSGDEFINVPIALLNTSPRASHAQKALREVLKTMSGQVVEAASVALPLLGTDHDDKSIDRDPEIRQLVESMLRDFCIGISALRDEGILRWREQ